MKLYRIREMQDRTPPTTPLNFFHWSGGGGGRYADGGGHLLPLNVKQDFRSPDDDEASSGMFFSTNSTEPLRAEQQLYQQTALWGSPDEEDLLYHKRVDHPDDRLLSSEPPLTARFFGSESAYAPRSQHVGGGGGSLSPTLLESWSAPGLRSTTSPEARPTWRSRDALAEFPALASQRPFGTRWSNDVDDDATVLATAFEASTDETGGRATQGTWGVDTSQEDGAGATPRLGWDKRPTTTSDGSPHLGQSSKSTTRSSSLVEPTWGEDTVKSYRLLTFLQLQQQQQQQQQEAPPTDDTPTLLTSRAEAEGGLPNSAPPGLFVSSPWGGGTAKPRKPVSADYRDVAGRVVSLAKLQSGSRYLQRLLGRGCPETTALILSEVVDNITALMTDPYGNYLCQRLFEACSVEQREHIIRTVAADAAAVARDRRGTHSMQALISLLKTSEEESLFMRTLTQPVILELALHPHGTHVIQRALASFREASLRTTLRTVIENLEELATNPHGLCVVKKSISAASSSSSAFKRPLLDRLTTSALLLIQSPFGNYAVQHALQVWGPLECQPILQLIKVHLGELSTQKFSSNVVEKAIEMAQEADAKQMIRILASAPVTTTLVESSYGSFVVQKALERASHDDALGLFLALSAACSNLQGRRLKAKWETVLEAARAKLNTKTSSSAPTPLLSGTLKGTTINNNTVESGAHRATSSSVLYKDPKQVPRRRTRDRKPRSQKAVPPHL